MPTNRRGVRVTLYLPDELREQARAAGINLSAELRAAVERRLRGEATPTVQAERVGDSVELRVSVPVNALRKLSR
jgi:post-segregation antitoxin (ccd killing protein)